MASVSQIPEVSNAAFVSPRKADLLGGLVQAAGNTPWIRRRAVSRADAYALEAHCHEEMSTLGRFLPDLFADSRKAVPDAL